MERRSKTNRRCSVDGNQILDINYPGLNFNDYLRDRNV